MEQDNKARRLSVSKFILNFTSGRGILSRPHMSMIIKIYPENPNEKAIRQVVEILDRDGVIIHPTDSVYAFGCSMRSMKAVERIRAITGKKSTEFSIICHDLSNVSTYARVDNNTFKVLKRNTPGPFTFILDASGKVPDKFLERKKSVGIRIPENSISLALAEALGCPIVTTSVKDPDQTIEYTTDPSLIYERYGDRIDAIIDGGYGNTSPTTVVDCTGGEPEIVREGLGELK